MSSRRTFYKTVVAITSISQNYPFEPESLAHISYEGFKDKYDCQTFIDYGNPVEIE